MFVKTNTVYFSVFFSDLLGTGLSIKNVILEKLGSVTYINLKYKELYFSNWIGARIWQLACISCMKQVKERFFPKHGITFFDLTNTKAMEEVLANNERFIINKDQHPNELGAERIFLATLESLNSQR